MGEYMFGHNPEEVVEPIGQTLDKLLELKDEYDHISHSFDVRRHEALPTAMPSVSEESIQKICRSALIRVGENFDDYRDLPTGMLLSRTIQAVEQATK